jgi:hypothetical protein
VLVSVIDWLARTSLPIWGARGVQKPVSGEARGGEQDQEKLRDLRRLAELELSPAS